MEKPSEFKIWGQFDEMERMAQHYGQLGAFEITQRHTYFNAGVKMQRLEMICSPQDMVKHFLPSSE